MKRVDAAIRLYKHGMWLLNKYKALAKTLGNDTELDEAIQDVEANDMAVKSLLNLLVSIDDGETLDENGLVRCGCGGKAQHEDFEDIFFKLSGVSCQRCGIVITTSRGKAKDAWNKAMGGD